MKKTLSLLTAATLLLSTPIALAASGRMTAKPKAATHKTVRAEGKVKTTHGVLKVLKKVSRRMVQSSLEQKTTSRAACKDKTGVEHAKCVQNFHGRGHWTMSLSSKSSWSMSSKSSMSSSSMMSSSSSKTSTSSASSSSSSSISSY